MREPRPEDRSGDSSAQSRVQALETSAEPSDRALALEVKRYVSENFEGKTPRPSPQQGKREPRAIPKR